MHLTLNVGCAVHSLYPKVHTEFDTSVLTHPTDQHGRRYDEKHVGDSFSPKNHDQLEKLELEQSVAPSWGEDHGRPEESTGRPEELTGRPEELTVEQSPAPAFVQSMGDPVPTLVRSSSRPKGRTSPRHPKDIDQIHFI